MEIESLRLDFLSLIILINITKAQNISEKEEKKKPEEPRPSRATQAVRDLGRTRAWVAHDLGGARSPGCTSPVSHATVTWVARRRRAQRLGRRSRAAQALLSFFCSFFCFFLSDFLFGCSENHKAWIFMFFPQI